MNHAQEPGPGDDAFDEIEFIAAALAPQAPPPHIQGRMLDRIRARIAADAGTATATPPSSLRTLRGDEGAWHPLAPAVDCRLLHLDGEFASLLVRLQAGASLPPHAHPAAEECYVISGDIWLSGTHLQAGDFQFVDTDVVHEGIRSEGGCLLHIRAHRSMAEAFAVT